MTVLVTPSFKSSVLVLETPDNVTIASVQPLVWETGVSSFQPGGVAYHFDVQLATDVGFTAIVEEGMSWVSAARFQYESSPGVWTALPSTGIAFSDIGKRVRYNPATTTLGTYFWRARVEEIY